MRFSYVWAPTAVVAMAVACAGVEGETGERPEENAVVDETTIALSERPTDGEEILGEGMEITTLALDNGSRLLFMEMAPGDVGILESIAAGAAPIETIEGIGRGTSPTDVFFAFAPEGTPVPERLLAAAPVTEKLSVQGWARPLLALAPTNRAPCNDTDVQNYVNGFNYNDRGTPNFRLNKIPDSTSFFADQYENWEPGYHFYGYHVGGSFGSTWFDVDRYITYVSICVIDTYDSRNLDDKAHPSINIPGYSNSHMGPQVRFSYRSPSAGSFSTQFFKDFAANEVNTGWAWHYNGNGNYDWRTEIDWAGGDDKFDIAHAVEDI